MIFKSAQFLYLAGIFLFMPNTAMAYLDPVTGSIVLQGIIGAVSAVLVFGRSIKAKIKSLFGKRNPPEEEKK